MSSLLHVHCINLFQKFLKFIKFQVAPQFYSAVVQTVRSTHCLMLLDVSFISSTLSLTSNASSPSSKANSQIRINHPPTPTICAHMLWLSAYRYKWTISTLIPGETPTVVQDRVPTGLLKNVASRILPPLVPKWTILPLRQRTYVLRLSPASFHPLFAPATTIFLHSLL